MQNNLPATQLVWNLGIRILHWTLAVSMIAAFATHESGSVWHEYIGYVALAAASIRIVLGFTANGYWRFSQFFSGITTNVQYAKDVVHKREKRYLGHNPLGGWMVVLLLADTMAAGLTGWLFTTDAFWGMEWLEELHEFFGTLIMPLLILHLAGVIFTSIRHRENLAAAMVHGRKKL